MDRDRGRGGRDSLEYFLKMAYELGFEVGFYGHYESLGWIEREKQRIIRLVDEMDDRSVNAINQSYMAGKKKGEQSKRVRLTGGADKELRVKPHPSIRIQVPGQSYQSEGMSRTPVAVLLEPELLWLPKALKAGRMTGIPHFLCAE